MHLELSDEHRAFREELREYFGRVITPRMPELRAEQGESREGGGPVFMSLLQQLGRDKLLGIGWPTEYGGQGRGPIEQYLFTEEVQRTGYPLPFLTLNTVGPTLMRYGSDEQKREFLPKILRGELLFAIGYSEAEAGTDLASLKTKAERDGNDWVINGAKMWTSLADHSHYIWLAVRTDPDAPKHRGISMFLVPTDAPGVKITPIVTIGGLRTNATYYEDVRVPAENLIGGENNGWSLITGQLNRERVSLANYAPMQSLLRDVIDWARETKLTNGSCVIDRPWVRSSLAKVHAHVEVLRLANLRLAWSAQHETLHPAQASAVKVFGSESTVEAYRAMLECFGAAGALQGDTPGAILRGRCEALYRNALILSFGGGANEVQRDIIAMTVLGMPHYKS
ncbi:MAG: acyl-CoA dehydrogenase family protein [Deltaproteobacteria bacterium]|nr:acyl-CoA dehydrogenase family protein [Deltaproteobacteria bacterium]